MDLANLKIINISFNQINGGSISLDIAKKSKYRENKVLLNWLLLREKSNGFNKLKFKKIFLFIVKGIKFLLNDLLKKLKSQGKKIYGYGEPLKVM